MATINLGRIKPVFRGAYSGATAYVVDDIVTSGGSSYICIQAHGAGTQAVTVTAYWSVLASTGTDVGTTITTEGDILFRDGSGLQRLAKGTAAQQLAMNAGADAPEWVTVGGGGVLQVKTTYYTAQHAVNSATWAVFNTAYGVTITPTASNSTFWLDASVSLGANSHDHNSSLNFFDSQVGTSDGDEIFTPTAVSSGSRTLGTFVGVPGNAGVGDWNKYCLWGCHPRGLYTPVSNNGSARTFYVCTKRNGAASNSSMLNYGDQNHSYTFAGVSSITVFEIANSII